MRGISPAGSSTQPGAEMAAFEAAAITALYAEAAAEALERDDSPLDALSTGESHADLLVGRTPLFNRDAALRASDTLTFLETIFAKTYTLDQCTDDFNSLLNKTIRTQAFLYHPGNSSDIKLRLEKLFNALEFPTAELLAGYTVDQLLQSVYFIHINTTTHVREIHIRDLTSDEADQLTRENQEILNLNQILIERERVGVSATRTSAYPTTSLPVQPEHVGSQS